MAKSYVSRAPGLRAIRVDLSGADHARLRVLAAQAGQPMSRLVRGLIEAHLARHPEVKKPGKIPRNTC